MYSILTKTKIFRMIMKLYGRYYKYYYQYIL